MSTSGFVEIEELYSIFKDCKTYEFNTDLVFFNDRDQFLFVGYKDLSPEELENALEPNFRYKIFDHVHKNDVYRNYYVLSFFSKCSEKFGEKQAKILSYLFFYVFAKFNQFHWGHSYSGILNCDIVVPDEFVNDVNEAFNLIFNLSNGNREDMRIIKLKKGCIFEMNIASFYHYISSGMFIYKTKIFSDNDFIITKERIKTGML